jgi:hypothetical protein
VPPLAALLAQVTTTSIDQSRVVGEPLPTWIVVGASLAVLIAILVAGALVRRRLQGQRPARGSFNHPA